MKGPDFPPEIATEPRPPYEDRERESYRTPGDDPVELSVYECPVCSRRFDDRESAEMCSATGTAPARLEPGDVVVLHPRYGWFDGSPEWVATFTPGRGADGGTYQFYYVVGAVTWGRPQTKKADGSLVVVPHSEHEGPFYHLFSRAIVTKPGEREDDSKEGWTRDDGHHWAYKVIDPPELPGAAEFIGRTTGYLL